MNLLEFIKERLTGNKSDNGNCEFNWDNSLRKILDKRYEREGRAFDNLSKIHNNLDLLPEKEFHRLMYAETAKILQEDEAENIRKKSLHRIIKTLRTKEEIKDAIKAGQKVLQQNVKPSKAIRVTDIHIKDKETGEITIKPYNYHNLPRDYDRYEMVKKKTYYPYKFPSKVAAYLIPVNLEVGEKVILEDLIEDIVGASHAWGTYRLDSAEAVWNGKKFEVDCDSYDVEITMG